MPATGLQATIYAGYGTAASALGAPAYAVYRGAAVTSNPTGGEPIFSLPAQFTNAKLAGYNYDRGVLYDDVVQNGLFDGTNCELGDYLVGPQGTFFIIAMQPMLPILTVQANAVVTLTRSLTQTTVEGGLGSAGPSQFGGTDPFWGRREDAADNTVGVTAPATMIASAGRATSRSDMPSAAPGPSRWRIYLSPGTFPKGTVFDRDIFTDDITPPNRHMVESAAWLTQGYRLEAIRNML